MIIECKNCLKKFTVRDADIPIKGRTVQCGNCSTQWFQMPITPSIRTDNLEVKKDFSRISSSNKKNDFNVKDIDQKITNNELVSFNGKNYRFLGSQWAEILTSGKTGRLARKKISVELNRITGREQFKKSKKDKKSDQSADQYQEVEGGMGIFSFLIVSLISIAAIILALDTFKNQLIPFFPNLDNYLIYIFETLNNIYIIITDLFNNYK